MPTTQTDPIRVLLIDDHKIIREGLRDLIQSRPDMAVIGETGSCADALKVASREQPDIIILDLDLGHESGLTLLPQLLEVAAGAGVIILTGVLDVKKRDRAMELGAKGMVLKEQGASELLNAIEKVRYTGDYWFEPGAANRLMSRKRANAVEENDSEKIKIASLTPTEREIITHIGEGLDNKQIAESMNIALSTARNNLSRIYNKLEIKGGRLELLVYAYRHGLIKSPD
ncbi:MAG TPA: response regulator transcription factor [Pyrinomonadaceae bacterium]|jgi:DNA-binding NarL/FixJ family response regulator